MISDDSFQDSIVVSTSKPLGCPDLSKHIPNQDTTLAAPFLEAVEFLLHIRAHLQ